MESNHNLVYFARVSLNVENPLSLSFVRYYSNDPAKRIYCTITSYQVAVASQLTSSTDLAILAIFVASRIFLDVLQTASVVALAISSSTLYWLKVRRLVAISRL